MKPFFVLGAAAAILALGGGASAHTGGGGAAMPMTGSSMMTEMMETMHGSIDKNRAINCGAVTNAQMTEAGEEMMEAIFGKEDHERVEEEMEKDMHDHDAMHTVMGMWATGCVGAEAAGAVAERYGLSGKLGGLERGAQNQFDWPATAVGMLVGVIIGWVAGIFIRKESGKQSV